MRQRTNTVKEGKGYYIQSVRSKNGNKKYMLTLFLYTGIFDAGRDSVCKHLDPFGNRRVGNTALCWKYNSLKEIQELLSVAKLKGWV